MKFRKITCTLAVLITLNNFTPALGNKDFYSSKPMAVTRKVVCGASAVFCLVMSILGAGTALGILEIDNQETDKLSRKISGTVIGIGFGLAAWYLSKQALYEQSLKKLLAKKTATNSSKSLAH